MADGISEKSYKNPLGVTAEDDGTKFVRVCIVLPGLAKQFFANKAKNAAVDVQFDSRSLDIKVDNLTTKQKSSGKKSENFRYIVKRLPDEVVKEGCSYAIEKDKIVLRLQKAVERPWAAELDQTGLETDRSDDQAAAM